MKLFIRIYSIIIIIVFIIITIIIRAIFSKDQSLGYLNHSGLELHC